MSRPALRAEDPDRLLVSEFELNQLGYVALIEGRTDDAIALLQLQVREYPEAWNAWDSLAEAYLTIGDVETASAHYDRSLGLNPANERARTVLDSLSAVEPKP